jgi:hypothetical protein
MRGIPVVRSLRPVAFPDGWHRVFLPRHGFSWERGGFRDELFPGE